MDVGSVKSKTVRVKPAPVTSQEIEMPQELININESITIIFDQWKKSGVLFLAAMPHESCYRMAQPLPKKPNSDDYEINLHEPCDLCKKGRVILNEMYEDQQFKKACESFRCKFNPPITVNYANAKDHVPRDKSSIRTLKERSILVFHQMPHTHSPWRLVEHTAMGVARNLNHFPSKHGVSKHCSPRMIEHQENLAFEQHCEHAAGECAQANKEQNPPNANAPRNLDCLYLRPTNIQQGGHELLHLAANRVINCRHIIRIPMSTSVIEKVHALSLKEGMPFGLKIENKIGAILYYSV